MNVLLKPYGAVMFYCVHYFILSGHMTYFEPGWEIRISLPGAFFAIFHSFLPLFYTFVCNFVWEPEAISFSPGVNLPLAPTYFPACFERF